MQEDTLLIRNAQRGDPASFEALMAPHERKLYALCLRMVGGREDAGDCAQEAMLRIWRAIGSYRQEASFTTWMYRIATNTCLDHIRRRNARPQVSLDSMTEGGFAPPAAERDEPHYQAEDTARRQSLARGISSLPADLRAALVLRDVRGLTYEEIAGALDTPLGTVKSRISRARERLRAILSQEAELFGLKAVHSEQRRHDE